MKAFVFLAEGFEEIEAIVPIDIMRRADITVNTVSISDNKVVRGTHGISVIADLLFTEADFENIDLLFLPGGMPGTKNLDAHQGLKDLIKLHSNQHKKIAAICAAPSILGKMGLLNGKEAICYPGFENQLIGANLSHKKVVKYDQTITAMGAGVAIEFALKLVEELKDKATAEKVSNSICFKNVSL